jgi:hypothetical protein
MSRIHVFFSITLLGFAANSSGFFLTPGIPNQYKPCSYRPTACFWKKVPSLRMQDSEGGDSNGLAGMTQEELDALPDLVMRGKQWQTFMGVLPTILDSSHAVLENIPSIDQKI